MEPTIAVGKVIRLERIRRDMKVQELAILAGYTSGYVSSVELGRVVPSLGFLADVGAVLGLSVRYVKEATATDEDREATD